MREEENEMTWNERGESLMRRYVRSRDSGALPKVTDGLLHSDLADSMEQNGCYGGGDWVGLVGNRRNPSWETSAIGSCNEQSMILYFG